MSLFYILLGSVVLSGFALFCIIAAKLLSNRKPRPRRERKIRKITYHPSLIPNSFYSSFDQEDNEKMESGYSRQDYQDAGFSDADIDCWGLDQPGAPDPSIAGIVVADMADGKIDGKFHFPFS